MKIKEYVNTYCAGCGLCHSVLGTEMKKIEGGFPNVDIGDQDEIDFYKDTCPVFYYNEDVKHDIWGKIQGAYVGYSSNPKIRYKAASGGALTEICSYLLHNKMVDGVIQTTYDPMDQMKTITVISSTPNEVVERCGSRYSISVPLKNILEMLEYGKKYAFVGKPCDVMALRRYINKNEKLQESIICLLSFFCAGEPSENAQDKLLKEINCSRDTCKSITYRGNGWPGYTTVVKSTGEIEKLEYKETWGRFLGRDLRNVCRFCMDGTGDAADIVCADFWYLDENETPDFSEHDGRNIVISRTDFGEQILKDVFNAGNLVQEENFTKRIDSEFHKYQPAQFKRKGTMAAMILAMKICGRNTPKYNRNYLSRCAAQIDFATKGKYFIGIIKRVIKGKI